ncbi:MAG: glucosyltransferase domain-containing protein [Lachnospiraceae bacterium]|nr:glucosyltransferase domain-containing protein [Lachnospiraceae bacterium]
MKKLIQQYTRKWLPVFFIDLAIAAFTYSLLMIHQLVNQLDGLWHGSESVANGWELSIGRWLWRYLDKARFHISPDPFASFLTLTLFILATIMMLEILEVEGRVRQVAMSMLFLISVSVCNNLSYRYMSATFGFSLFFAALAALLVIRIKKPVIAVLLGAVSVALSNACYQAFTGVVCLLIVLYIAFCVKAERMESRDIGKFTLRALIAGIAGFVIYYGILMLEFARYDVQMNEYNGASNYSIAGIVMNLPVRFLTAYHDWFEYFGNENFRISIIPAGRYLYMIFVLLLIAIALISTVKIAKRSIGMAVIYIVCILLVPAAVNVCLLIAYNSFMSLQMSVPMAMSLPALACVCAGRTGYRSGDEESGKDEPGKQKTAIRTVRIAAWTVSAFIIYTQFFMVQYDQQSMYMGRQSCLAMADQIDAYLVKHDLLYPGYKYVFVGKPSGNREFYMNDFFGTANQYAQFGNFTDDPGGARMSWQGLWWFERGIRMDFAPEERWAEILTDEAVGRMPVFPEEGSCVLYDDVVVVKVSDQPAEQ